MDLLERARTTNLADLLLSLGIAVKHRRFPCPLCGASGRACGLLRDTSRWHCFGCDGGGSLVEIAMALTGSSTVDRRVFEELERLIGPDAKPIEVRPVVREREKPALTLEQVWDYWRRTKVSSQVSAWVLRVRGIPWPVSPDLGQIKWVPKYRPDLQAAVDAGPCACFPLRSTSPEIASVVNLLVRPLQPTVMGPVDKKPWKGRLLNWGEGSVSDGEWPLAYGDAERLRRVKAGLVFVCEGAMDTYTLERLLQDMPAQWLRTACVVGAYAADNLSARWPRVVASKPEAVRWLVVPHLDPVRRGESVGVARARELVASGVAAGRQIGLFPWGRLLEALGLTFQGFMESGRTDINDLVRLDLEGAVVWDRLTKAFKEVLCG